MLVIVVSAINVIKGGKNQLPPNQSGCKEVTLEIGNNGIPNEPIENQSYQRSDYVIISLGFKIAGRVTPVFVRP